MKKSSTWNLNLLKSCFIALLLCCFGIVSSEAQQQQVPLNHQFFNEVNRQLLKKSESHLHIGFKPILQSDLSNVDSNTTNLPTLRFDKTDGASWIKRKLFFEHLFQLNQNDVQISLDPLVNFEFGEEQEADPRTINLYKNTRGFLFRLNLGDKISVRSEFRETQANLPLYLSARTKWNQEAYGQGRVKVFEDGYDFNMASSVITYKASERLAFQFGSDKHFVGNGYRSFLLSDLSFNYPFIRLQSTWLEGKVKYENMYTLFQDLERVSVNQRSEGLFERKQGVFHYLSYSPHPKFNVALFEGVVFPSLDTSGRIGVNGNYWVPFIFLNSMLENKRRPGNTMQGLNQSYRLNSTIEQYGQLSFFDGQLKSVSFQAGLRYYLSKQITLQTEYNRRTEDQNQSLFYHYSQSLAHPVKSSFSEYLGAIYWKRGPWMTGVVGNLIETNNHQIQFVDFKQAYLINPVNRLSIMAGVQFRSSNEEVNIFYPQQNSTYIYFGLSTRFQNLYFNY